MKNAYKRIFIVTIGVIPLILTYVIYRSIMRETIATTFSHVQYVVLETEDFVEKREISTSVNQEISEKIKELASIKILGRKSISFGKLSLFDKDE